MNRHHLDRLRYRLRRLRANVLLWLRIGRPERVESIDGASGVYEIRTAGSTVLRLTVYEGEPRPPLRRYPGPGSASSWFDAPRPPMAVKHLDVRVRHRAHFVDTAGSYLYGAGTWTTSEVKVIELRRSHCPGCGRGLVRGWCWHCGWVAGLLTGGTGSPAGSSPGARE